jgi:hypothetical protein
MGEIVSKKQIKDKVRYKIELDINEYKRLEGNHKNIKILEMDSCQTNSKIIRRGNNNSTHFFLLPLELRSKKKMKFSEKYCHGVSFNKKAFFVYTFIKDNDKNKDENKDKN